MSCGARTPHVGGPSNGASRGARPCTAARPAARRERLRLADAELQRAGRPGADPAVPDQYPGATRAAVLRARDHAAYQAASISREAAGATAPLVTKQLTARAGRQGSPDGQADQPSSMPVIRDAGDAPGRPAGLWDSGAASMAALGVDGRLSGRRLDDSPAGTVVRGCPQRPIGGIRLAGTAGAADARPSAGAAGVSDLAI
jgi:hypothetical protein